MERQPELKDDLFFARAWLERETNLVESELSGLLDSEESNNTKDRLKSEKEVIESLKNEVDEGNEKTITLLATLEREYRSHNAEST
jgi:hypothetical protein